jgi:hypothetical protein
MKGRNLLQRDIRALVACGISHTTAQAAGLRRVTSEEGAATVGRKDSGTYAGIVFPYRLPGDEAARDWRLRRDTPDLEPQADGTTKEKAKYLSAPGRGSMLYFAPGTLPADLANVEKDLAITEGEKKALALHDMAQALQLPLIPVGIAGVYNWQGTTGKTNGPEGQRQDIKGLIPDLGHIAMEGRKVFVAFDRDAATNWKVRTARFKLANALQKLGARVFFVEIPPDSPHKGIDDLIGAEGHNVAQELFNQAKPANAQAEVEALIESAPTLADVEVIKELTRLIAPMNKAQEVEARAAVRKSLKERVHMPDLDALIRDRRQFIEQKKRESRGATELTYSGKPYEATGSGLVWWKSFNGQHTPQTLANFTARIVADVVRDDGQEKTRALKIAANVGDFHKTFTISAAEFGRMEWPIEHMGARAIVYPGLRDHLRTAIQTLSEMKEEHHAYLHTGWSEADGRCVYMHAGGGIGEQGNNPELVVELPIKLASYKLPEPPEGRALIASLDTTLKTLQVAPPKFTYPLFAAAFRSVLGPADCSIFLAGQTGTGKSEIAAIFQQFFGAGMNAKNLPAGWESTANALESLSHTVKNALMVIDDFVPRGGSNDVSRLNQIADRILRGQGNNSGRARMGADTTIRAPKSPRGLIVGTGEDVPRGHSLRARLVILQFGLADMVWTKLTECQHAAREGVYASTMAAFIKWIAPRMPAMGARIEEVLADYRERWNALGHKRTPGNLANLAVGLEMFLEFAQEAGALTAKAAEHIRQESENAFIAIAKDQGKELENGEPCQMFLETLTAAIGSGAAHVAATDGQQPPSAGRWGWRQDQSDLANWRPQGVRVGWVEDDDIYIEPQSAYKVVNQFFGSTAECINISLSTLKRRLKQQSKLASHDVARESVTIRRKCEGATREVLHFSEPLGNMPLLRHLPDIPDIGRFEGKCRVLGFSEDGQKSLPDTCFEDLSISENNNLEANVGNVGFSWDKSHVAGGEPEIGKSGVGRAFQSGGKKADIGRKKEAIEL